MDSEKLLFRYAFVAVVAVILLMIFSDDDRKDPCEKWKGQPRSYAGCMGGIHNNR